MRNWNVYFLNYFCRHYQVVPYLWGIETIGFRIFFELISRCTLPMRNWNKLIQLQVFHQQLRCTLPMRNWNKVQYVHLPVSFYVVPYLWGIETKHSAQESHSIQYFVVPYLWGIETIIIQCFIVSDITSCTLPMRNWNPVLDALL